MPRGKYTRPAKVAAPAKATPLTPAQADAPALSVRATEARRERRRRDDGDLDRMGRMALSIPSEIRERWQREGKVGRWVRDDPNRQLGMHANDWDVTPHVSLVPESRDGEGKLILMEKYRDWFDDDQRKKLQVVDQREEALVRQDGAENRRSGDGLVVPKGQINKISRGL